MKIKFQLIFYWSIVLFFVIVVAKSVASAESVATPSGTMQIDKQVQNLKDKIASKVEELRKKDQKALAGVIKSIEKDNTIKIVANDGRDLIVKYDNSLTKIFLVAGTTKKETQFSDLQMGDYIIVTGPIMDITISANYIYKDDQFVVQVGKVTEVNKTDYFIKVISSEKDTYTLDIETYTKLFLMDIKTLEMSKSGTSKIKEGDTVHFVVIRTEKEKELNRHSAERILVIPQEYFSK